MIHEILVECPYCGESFETIVDASAGDAEYIEDCQVCCRPIEVRIEVNPDGELLHVTTRGEDD